MIAVIYSGSRYANWKLAEKGKILAEFQTEGINPYFNDIASILQLLNKNNELITYAEKIKKIYFFGAGASSAKRQQIIHSAFAQFFKYSKITVDHDLKAAALATCGDSPGIVSILGSGSNAGYYTGGTLVANNNGLGFILNDEGSANWLGRQLLKNFLTDDMPPPLKGTFIKKYNLDRKVILDKLYKQAHPVLFLASFSEFLLEYQKDEFIRKMVIRGFSLFFDNYIAPLVVSYPDALLYFTGTISAGFEGMLRETAANRNLTITAVVETPIYNVLDYCTKKNYA